MSYMRVSIAQILHRGKFKWKPKVRKAGEMDGMSSWVRGDEKKKARDGGRGREAVEEKSDLWQC